MAEVEEYERQINDLVARIAPSMKPFDVILDSTGGGVLAKEVLEPLARVSSMLAARGVRKVAVVNPSVIKAMQTKRVTSPTLDLQVFPSNDAAHAWLQRDGAAGRHRDLATAH